MKIVTRMHMHIFVPLLPIAVLIFAGCSVVEGGPDAIEGAYATLGEWRVRGEARMSDLKYPEYEQCRRVVNVWIESKARSVELVGNTYFGQVGLTPPAELSKQVDALLGSGKNGGDAAAENIAVDPLLVVFSWLLEEYRKSRIEEAMFVSTGLREYLWPEKPK